MTDIINNNGSITENKSNELVFVQNAGLVNNTVARIAGGKRIFAVTDENVSRFHPQILPSNNVFVLPAGEDGKTLATAENICRAMLAAGMTRNAVVAAYGGGVIGDVAGFAAAIYMRGVDFINVPTTLLSQVDSAIGGKTGVNLDGYKNMIGAFKMPQSIVVCPELLATLPPREWRCGMGELVKTAFLDENLYTFVCENIDKLLARDAFAVEKAITNAAKFKKRITDEDPTEKGLRAILNLGHTVGHALEKCDNHKLSHGEYVLLGMKIEFAMLSGYAPYNNFLRSADSLLSKAGIPVLPCVTPEDVTAAAKTDKKNGGGKIAVIGLTAAGKAYVSDFTAAQFCRLYSSAVNEAVKKRRTYA